MAEEQNLKDTLLAAATQFLLSPAGIGIVSQLAEKAGVEDVEEFVQDAAKVKKLVDENIPEIKTRTTKN